MKEGLGKARKGWEQDWGHERCVIDPSKGNGAQLACSPAASAHVCVEIASASLNSGTPRLDKGSARGQQWGFQGWAVEMPGWTTEMQGWAGWRCQAG